MITVEEASKMDFRQKEIDMIKALDTPKAKEMFDTKEEGLDFIAEKLQEFPAYVNVVIRQEIMMPMWHATLEGQELRDKVQGIDQSRRMQHNVTIDAVNILNRMCANLGLEPFADIDTSNRYQVADFAGMWTAQMYNNGIGKTMDEVAYGRHEEFKDDTHARMNAAYGRLKAEQERMDGNDVQAEDGGMQPQS